MIDRNALPCRMMRSFLCLAVAAAQGAWAAGVVLLDEYWTPEILQNDVVAAEIDTTVTGDPLDAKSGEVAAVLTNQTGAPGLRFRGAAMIRLEQIPLPASEARLWYRTDAWDGRWRLEVWAFTDGVTTEPQKALEAVLDGGGENGRLLADGEWHQAKGQLAAAGIYAGLPKARLLVTYVWLVPLDGWGTPHRTLVDRCEIGPRGAPADALPEPSRRVRPNPGAQTASPGWVWWEAEDAVRHDFPSGGAYRTFTREQQNQLSNGDWLQWHGCTGHSAAYTITLAEAGTYAFWVRGSGPDGPFQFRWDHQDWRVVGPDDFDPPLDQRLIYDTGEWQLQAGWVRLGELTLAAGSHAFDLVGLPDAGGFAIDCFLLTKGPFKPAGTSKPPAP